MTTDRAVYGAWPFERCIVIVAHPDDAEFTMAGTVAAWTRRGCRVILSLIHI